MTTRHLVDPELACGIELFPNIDFETCDIGQLRSGISAALPPVETYANDAVSIEHIVVPGAPYSPAVPVIVYRPIDAAGPLPVFLNIHGGGFMFGSAADNGPGDVRTAIEIGCLVASVEYRLAPEDRAPAALEDCYAVLRWLYHRAEELSLDRTRFSIGGQSAGGGLAAALALIARDRGEIPLCFQSLIYPMLDDRTVVRAASEDNPHTGEFIWTRASNAFGWRALLSCEPGELDVPATAAAARATDLSGLPPAYIMVGMLDLFLEEDMEYAARLMKAGVPTELHVLPGAYHGFEIAMDARLTQASEIERRNALARAFEQAQPADASF